MGSGPVAVNQAILGTYSSGSIALPSLDVEGGTWSCLILLCYILLTLLGSLPVSDLNGDGEGVDAGVDGNRGEGQEKRRKW